MTGKFGFGGLLLLMTLFSASSFAETLVGVTDFAGRMHLTFPQVGVVNKIHVRQGQSVKQGQVLISLDSRIAAAKVAGAEARLNSFAPILQQKLTELDKANELYDRDSLARVDLDNAEHAYQIAKADYDAARANLDVVTLQLQQAQLLAPIDGLVIGLNAHQGQVIDVTNSYQTLVELINPEQMIAKALVSDEVWHRGITNKSATVRYQGKDYPGTVIYVGRERIEKVNGKSAFEIRVLFSTSGDIPANIIVTIEIQE